MAKKKLSQVEQDLESIGSLLDQLASKMQGTFQIDPDKSIQSYKNALKETVDLTEKISSYQEEFLSLGKDAKQMSVEEVKTLQKQVFLNNQKLQKQKIILQDSHKQLQNEKAQAIAARKSVAEIGKIEKQIQQNEKAQDSFNDAIQASEKAAEDLQKELAKAQKADAVEKFKKGGEKALGKINDAAKSVTSTIAGAFGLGSLNPLEILLELFGFAVKTTIELDTEIGEAAKSMNQVYLEASKSRLAMDEIAIASGELLINGTHLQKTFLALNQSLGTGVVFEKMGKSLQQDIAFMAMMENYAGLTAEESNAILKYSLQLGKSAKQTAGTLMAQYKASALKHKIVVNEKEALKEISKLSDAVKISIAGGAQGLAKALAAAKGLGVSLDDVRNTAGSLLNFEESIEKELSAELLTGKQLNLEKARQAALNNDLKTVAEEIKNQVGGAAAFAEMNRIQQEAIAAAVGMTVEQLSTALAAQEQQKEISEGALSSEESAYKALVAKHGEQGAIGIMMQQQLELQKHQASQQERIAAAKLKEKDILARDLIPLLMKLDKNFEDLLKKAKEFFNMLGGWKTVLIAIGAILAISIVANIVKMVSEIGKAARLTRALVGVEKALAGAEVVGNSYKMAGGLGPVGIAAIAGLMGAGLAALATYSVMSDGIIGPSSGGGFGDRVLFGPEGAISFNNKDTIVAGTNLFPKKVNDYVSSPGSLQMGNNKEMSELKDAILALASRPINVQVGGETIIKATTGALPNEAGLAAAKNSFELQ